MLNIIECMHFNKSVDVFVVYIQNYYATRSYLHKRRQLTNIRMKIDLTTYHSSFTTTIIKVTDLCHSFGEAVN